MTNQKHFKAVSRETKEEIEFGLEDIEYYVNEILVAGNETYCSRYLSHWLKDYELFYKHQGVWFPYEEGVE
jgi:hypothetical protein